MIHQTLSAEFLVPYLCKCWEHGNVSRTSSLLWGFDDNIYGVSSLCLKRFLKDPAWGFVSLSLSHSPIDLHIAVRECRMQFLPSLWTRATIRVGVGGGNLCLSSPLLRRSALWLVCAAAMSASLRKLNSKSYTNHFLEGFLLFPPPHTFPLLPFQLSYNILLYRSEVGVGVGVYFVSLFK